MREKKRKKNSGVVFPQTNSRTTKVLPGRSKTIQKEKSTPMKHLQYFQKKGPAPIDISMNAPGSEDRSRNGNALKRYKQTLACSAGSSHNQLIADRIRNYSLHILMFVLTGHAVLGKFKNVYEKNVLAANEGLNILRIIFLAGRGNFSEKFLTQIKTIALVVNAQIDTVMASIETVVWAIWPYLLIL